MSEDLHTYIEPELEARLTALVLGEASEFEADELEKLIKENPELAIFHRRIQAIHDLLGETVKPKPDESWQLSTERRSILKETFTRSQPSSIARSHRRSDPYQWKAAVSIAACLLVCVVVFALVKPVYKNSAIEAAYAPEIISYSATSEEEDEKSLLWRFAGEGKQGRTASPKRDFSGSGVAPEGNFRVDSNSSEFAHRKPSIPSTSASKVIASNTSGTTIPVPNEGIPTPSLDFGNSDDFGMSYVDKEDTSVTRRSGTIDGIKGLAPYRFMSRNVELGDLFELKGGDSKNQRGIVVTPTDTFKDPFAPSNEKLKPGVSGGFEYPTEYEPPELSKTIESGKSTGTALFKTPATPIVEAVNGISNIAEREVSRRAAAVSDADKAFMMGRKALAEKNYKKALEKYQEAEALLPPGPATEDRWKAYGEHFSDAGLALAQKYRHIGKYNEARQLLGDLLQRDPTNKEALEQLKFLEDPVQPSPALTFEHAQEVDQVRKKLYAGAGYYNLGKYDEAEAEMKKTLKIDPNNKAARRWLEKIAATKSDYYRSAYDHTRAELLTDVDRAWEMAVPAELDAEPSSKPVAKPTPSLPVVEENSKLASIRKDLQKKSDEVAEKRKKLMDVAERVGVIWVESERGGVTFGGGLELRDLAEKQLYEANREKEQLSSQINKLLTLDDDELVSMAADLPDVGFKENYSRYVAAKRELQVKKAQGLAKSHPDIVAREKSVAELESSLRKRAVNVRETLKSKLKIVDGRVEKMREVLNDQQDRGTEKARSFQEFNKLRKEYHEAKYDLIKFKQATLPSNLKVKKTQDRVAHREIPLISPTAPKALPDETQTRAQPFSTFSLNVSDVSFKLAKAALLEKGQWPDAAKVRTEEFVNAFNYGDPSPSRGEPVSCTIEQSAHPFLQQRNLLRIGMKTAASGRSAPLRLTILLDNSGSMEREDREASVLAAMEVLAAQLGPQDVITLVGFASKPRLLADRISGDKAAQLVHIVSNTPSEGGTNLEEALRLARTLALRQRTKGAQDRVVLITDGVANLGNTVPEQLAREIEIMRQKGISFDACGVGAEGLNDDILESLTRKGDGRYYFLNRAEDADAGFAKQLAGALTPAAKNVKVQVKFNPGRVSRYRLLGFEKHRLKKKDFRNDKVDAAEMAAEEAGNAVYQIQVNPNGTGELGQVFVRFLDTNTNRMVERSWPLPYEPQAKFFDQAAPSMQLAGAAAMLGEKLHGTDAGSVRFSMISKTLGKLRSHYAEDSKVQDFIRMCEKVK